MPKYRKFDPRTWRDEGFKILSDREKLVAIYVFTAQSNRCGIFPFSLGQAAEDLGWSRAAVARAFECVLKVFDWKWDAAARVLYIPTWWKYNQPENSSHLLGCLSDLHELPATSLLDVFKANTQHLSPKLREALVRSLVPEDPDTSSPTCPPTSATQCATSGTGAGAETGTGAGKGNGDLFDATCSECGIATQVTFRPDPNRPVYCSACYRTRNGHGEQEIKPYLTPEETRRRYLDPLREGA